MAKKNNKKDKTLKQNESKDSFCSILNNSETLLHLPGKHKDYQLLPGITLSVPVEVWEMFEGSACPSDKKSIGDKIYERCAVIPKKTKEIFLSDLTEEEIRDVLPNFFDLKAMRDHLIAEKRPDIAKLIQKRIKFIEKDAGAVILDAEDEES